MKRFRTLKIFDALEKEFANHSWKFCFSFFSNRFLKKTVICSERGNRVEANWTLSQESKDVSTISCSKKALEQWF